MKNTDAPNWRPDEHGVYWAHQHPRFNEVVRAMRAAYDLPVWAIRGASYGHPRPGAALPNPRFLRDTAAHYVLEAARTGEHRVTAAQLAAARRIVRNIDRRVRRRLGREGYAEFLRLAREAAAKGAAR